MESRPPDPWTSGDPYNAYVGRWSRLVARELLAWLDIPAERDWLDVGCGTGALTQTIIEHAHPRSVTGVDPSPAFIEFARAQVADERARFEVGDGQALAFSAERFDAAVSGLVLNFVPDPHRAVGEMKRTVRSGGTVASYVWDYAGEMQLMRYFWDAAVELDPAAAELDEGKRFPIAEPGPSRTSSRRRVSATSVRGLSTWRRPSPTSTTTGRRSRAVRALRPPTRARWPKSKGPFFAR
jgi:SAM-dependent methyltransferase